MPRDLNFGKLAKFLDQGRGMNHAIMQWLKIDQLLRMNVTSTQGMSKVVTILLVMWIGIWNQYHTTTITFVGLIWKVS